MNISAGRETCSDGYYKKVLSNIYQVDYPKVLGINTTIGQITKDRYNRVDLIMSYWTVPIGDRNMKEFGRCRQYEKDKGVCYEETLN